MSVLQADINKLRSWSSGTTSGTLENRDAQALVARILEQMSREIEELKKQVAELKRRR